MLLRAVSLLCTGAWLEGMKLLLEGPTSADSVRRGIRHVRLGPYLRVVRDREMDNADTSPPFFCFGEAALNRSASKRNYERVSRKGKGGRTPVIKRVSWLLTEPANYVEIYFRVSPIASRCRLQAVGN